MGQFTAHGRVRCVVFWGRALVILGALQLWVCAAESSDAELQPSVFVERGAAGSVGSVPLFSPLNLAVKFPEDLEVTNHCLELLHLFGQRYEALANCLVSNARPLKVCQNCYMANNSFSEIYANITSDQSMPENMSCHYSLMRLDRLMLLNSLYSKVAEIWSVADCNNCLSADLQSLSNSTLKFLDRLNTSLSCFEEYQGNHSELCKQCKTTYKDLNDLYGNTKLCIDIEDGMNVTRRLWSKHYNCSIQSDEIVPVIAVSGFMLFLPVIFYLSNFLHSEQKKRKLINPKRVRSSQSLMNIQDRLS
ncbi:osteopetrosis-associated transmembrane protein 1 [Hoplias malabaricus]|uniref:osteopetrosis-associated transmembrane protein 1 n=1 Tax=Hoplias malabaricus TaxID=27720 RepID=UPI003461BAE1